MPLFTHLIAVDWSAANHPQTGANSIWVAENNDVPVNLPTRFSCSDWLRARMTHAITNNERLLISCDFARISARHHRRGHLAKPMAIS